MDKACPKVCILVCFSPADSLKGANPLLFIASWGFLLLFLPPPPYSRDKVTS